MKLPARRILPFLCVAVCSALLLPAPIFGAEPDDTARTLAGLPPLDGSAPGPLPSDARAKRLDEAWGHLEKSQLSPARAWAEVAIGDARKNPAVLYYAFSGPDFLYADTFFPNCRTYVLCGLEPVGPIPDLKKFPPEKLVGALDRLQVSLDSVLSFSFFKTKDMKVDLQHETLQGTTPILLTFLARLGKTVKSAELVTLDRQGEVAAVEPGTAPATTRRSSITNGVKIEFTAGSGAPLQTLYYFSTDISNDGIKNNPGFVSFCKKLEPGVGLVKAASYLMHEEYFSGIRDLLLERCAVILQDDSGIPAAKFPGQEWEIRPFGKYLGPISLFKDRRQAELDRIYAGSAPAPLPFGIGYRHRTNESNLLLAVRKPGIAKVKSPEEAAETGRH